MSGPSSGVTRPLLLAAGLAALLVSATPANRGQSSASITFVDSRQPASRPSGVATRPLRPVGLGSSSSIQFGQTSATSNQQTMGNTQTNQGSASGISFQQQTGLGGATQTTNNQGVIQALQQAGGGSGGGGGQQSSNNQVNIQSSQLQQNVEGTLVNVEAGNKGVVIVNTQDQTGKITGQKVVNNRPIAPQTAGSSGCLYRCKRGRGGPLYCCDDGSNPNRGGDALDKHAQS